MLRLVLNNIPRPWLIRASYIVSPFLSWYYRGHQFEDPIDQRTYRTLLPYGYGDHQRKNALAPGSMSLERHRLLWLYLKKHTELFDPRIPQAMLHVAPEQCFLKRFKKLKHLNYITGDLESPIADFKMDLHEIPFKDNSFDIVLCNHVLEHVQDDKRCMKEIFRVLRPGGWAILQTPISLKRKYTDEDPSITDPKIRKERFGQYDHVRAYGADYPVRLEEAGFRVWLTNFQDELGLCLINRYCLQENDPLYVCKKK
ncbi:MAG TPA: methyltransferase domain-containing protein [Edaphocola sp.]|nr:methyltransferase domain-containing protein [Edaphocola sp.]